MEKHLATAASIGFSGRRCGTTYAYSPRAARGLMMLPYFRFRNDECARICRDAWSEPPPYEGEMFVVAAEDERPDVGWSTKIDAHDPLRKDSLVRWEGEIIPFGKACFARIGETIYYEWSEMRSDYCWHGVGRLLKLKVQP